MVPLSMVRMASVAHVTSAMARPVHTAIDTSVDSPIGSSVDAGIDASVDAAVKTSRINVAAV